MVSFGKLKIKLNNEVKEIIFNEQTIEVKQYLPINQKLELINNALELSVDESKFYNSGKIELFFALEIIFAYTNISFTEKQKEDKLKLYDTIISSGLYDAVVKAIPYSEMLYNYEHLMDIVKNVYNYKNSAAGILEVVSTDYSNLELDALKIKEDLTANPESLDLLKNVVTKLG